MIYALFLASGAAALVLQVAWVRSLTLIFGASHEAVSVVLAAFMAGLALGGFVFGRLAARISRPLRAYGLLELGTAAAALLLPWLLEGVDSLYATVALRVEGVPWTLHALRVALSFAALLLPTFLMGGTLPLLAQVVVTRAADFGSRLSALYAVNTLGGVAGAVAGGFAVLPALGIWRTQLATAAAIAAVGAIALLLDRRAPAFALAATPVLVEADPPRDAPHDSLLALRLAFFGTAMSGSCALALEVMWMRAISVAVGTTTYSFSVMLAAFLSGIALGSALHAALPQRGRLSVQLGLVLVAAGTATGVVAQAIPLLPSLAVYSNAVVLDDAGGVRAATALLVSFAVMLVPCTLMGLAFPLSGRARLALAKEVGHSAGDLVGWNTIGAIVGSLGAGFALIPLLGLQRGQLLVAALYVLYGAMLLAVGVTQSADRVRRLGRLAAAALALAGLAAPFVLPDWDPRALGAFRNNARTGRGAGASQILERILAETRVLYYREGRTANVSVVQRAGRRALLIDGKSVASDSLTDVQHELLLGHLPVLLHPDPRNALVVGLGAGITLGGVLAHPLEHVTLVEIEPAVTAGARFFDHVNGGALDDPRLRVVFQDGRNYLRTTGATFDVITADPIHPWARGATHLYTTEYYRLIAQRLSPGGIACQWLPLYELSLDDVRSAIATFAGVFPNATLWQTAYDAVLIGSDSPFDIEPLALKRRMSTPAVTHQLGQIGLSDPLSLLSEFTLDRERIDTFTGDAALNTDDNLRLEFSSPLSIGTSHVVENVRAIDGLRAELSALGVDVAPLLPPDRSPAEVLAAYRFAKAQTVAAQGPLQQVLHSANLGATRRLVDHLERVHAVAPEYGRSSSLLSLALLAWGTQLQSVGRLAEAERALERAAALVPVRAEAWYRLASVHAERGDWERAKTRLAVARELRPDLPTPAWSEMAPPPR